MKALKSRRKKMNSSYSFKELPFPSLYLLSLPCCVGLLGPNWPFLFPSADPQLVFQDSILMTRSLLEIITRLRLRAVL